MCNIFSADEETADYWFDAAEYELTQALVGEELNENTARNVIMFLGRSKDNCFAVSIHKTWSIYVWYTQKYLYVSIKKQRDVGYITSDKSYRKTRRNSDEILVYF